MERNAYEGDHVYGVSEWLGVEMAPKEKSFTTWYQVRRCTGQLVPSDVGQTRHDGSAYQTCTSTVRNEFK